MKNIYINPSPASDTIYVGDPNVDTIPDNLLVARRIYHVTKCDKDESDFGSTNLQGGVIYFKFTSESGREAKKLYAGIPTSTNAVAISNPECLIELGLSNRVEYLGVDNVPKEDEVKPTETTL